jgi:hypothetical protein
MDDEKEDHAEEDEKDEEDLYIICFSSGSFLEWL